MPRPGKMWETETKKLLKVDFRTDLVFHLTNVMEMDFIVFTHYPFFKIVLVEAKSTKHNTYYPLENKNKRKQCQTYFKTRDSLRNMGVYSEVYFYLNLKGKIIKRKFDSYDDIPKSIS